MTDKYSNYFDSNFNFNNIVYPSKAELVDKLMNVNCKGDIMLEPRLQEYLKKKKFYKENDIEPCVTPEQEYQITDFDRKVLKAFLKGRKDLYNNKEFNIY